MRIKLPNIISASILFLIFISMFIPVIGVGQAKSINDNTVHYYSLFQFMIVTNQKGYLNGLFFVSGIIVLGSLMAAIVNCLVDKLGFFTYIFIVLSSISLLAFIPLIYPIIFVITLFSILISLLISKIIIDRHIN